MIRVETSGEAPHGHVRLWAGDSSTGEPVYELVPAEDLGSSRVRVLGTPALVLDCAAGDVVEVQPEGRHRVVRRGGNVAVLARVAGGGTDADVAALRAAVADLGGLVEAPVDRRFIVVTVPVTATFPAIEGVMSAWVARTTGADWGFTNVYDDNGRPLGWWETA